MIEICFVELVRVVDLWIDLVVLCIDGMDLELICVVEEMMLWKG